MKRILMAAVIAALVGSGAALGSPPEKQPPKVPVPAADAAKFAGKYYKGAGLGSINITLNADGSYTAEWHECVDPPVGEAAGNWCISHRTLILSPVNDTAMMKPFTKTLDVVERNGRVVFVEPDLRESFAKYGIRRNSCFQRTDQMPKHKGG